MQKNGQRQSWSPVAPRAWPPVVAVLLASELRLSPLSVPPSSAVIRPAVFCILHSVFRRYPSRRLPPLSVPPSSDFYILSSIFCLSHNEVSS